MSRANDNSERCGPEALHLRLTEAPALKLASGHWRPLNDTDAAMFALLALRGEQARPNLANLLWPDRGAAAARNNLRQRLDKLEKLAGRPLFKRGDKLRLALMPDLAHDLPDPFDALRLDPDASSPCLLGQFNYSRRGLLAEIVSQERQARHAQVIEALENHAYELESSAAIARAIAYARRLHTLEPLSEHAAKLLMRLHHRRGDRASALEVFDTLKRRLIDEMGEPMAPETLELAVQIGRGDVPRSTPLPALPIVLRHPPRTVGRDPLIAQADELRLTGSHIVLIGPAGAGKTRVLDELVRRWGIRAVVNMRAGDEREPHALLRRLAQALEPLPAAPLPSSTTAVLRWLTGNAQSPSSRPLAEREVALAVAAAVDSSQACGAEMVAIDNLHYADAESVVELCRLLDRSPMRWLIACRDLKMPEALHEWLVRPGRLPDPQLDVAPLDKEAVADWLQSLQLPQMAPCVWADALCRHCGGHPHSIAQVLRELHRSGQLLQAQPPAELPVPQQALQDVGRRLGRSDPLAQKLAFVAALAGQAFDAELALAVLDCSAIDIAPAWRQLEAAGILTGSVFCHDLVERAVADAVPQPLLPGIHRDIAAAMDRRSGAPASRAMHWLAAGDPRRGGEALLEVADQALAAGLQARARHALLEAAAAFERAGMTQEAFDARRRGVMLTMATVSAVAAESDARELLERAGDDRSRVAALCALSEVLAQRQVPEALETAREANALAVHVGDPALTARARLREAIALRATGHDAAALERLDELMAHASHLTPDERQQSEVTRLMTLDTIGRREEALPLGLAALEHALALGDYTQASVHASGTGLRLGYLGRPSEAVGYFERSIEYCVRAGAERGWVLIDEGSLADMHADLGHFDRALAIHERIVPELRRLGYTPWACNAEDSVAGTLLRLGQPRRALQRLRAPLPADNPAWLRAKHRLFQARAERALGQPALAGMREAQALLSADGAPIHPYVAHRLDLEIAVEQGPTSALAQARRCIGWARSHGHLALARHAAWVEIEALVDSATPLRRPAALTGWKPRWPVDGKPSTSTYQTCGGSSCAPGTRPVSPIGHWLWRGRRRPGSTKSNASTCRWNSGRPSGSRTRPIDASSSG